MGHFKFTGCGTALISPFKNNGMAVDYEAMAKLVERQMSAGVHFLVPLGTTGETPCLTTDEKIKLLQVTKESLGSAPIAAAACLRAFSMALRAERPSAYTDEALPHPSDRNGAIASRTVLLSGVVAAWSR